VKEVWMEKIKDIQGSNDYGSLAIEELCLAFDVEVPKYFKIPDLKKCDGSTNPIIHLNTYCTKMTIWSKDETFLISFSMRA
jgi:hypothetical protein